MGDDETKFRDAVRGFAEAQQVAVEVEQQQSPRDKLLQMTGGDEENVATLRHVIKEKDEQMKKKDEQIKKKDEELTANRQVIEQKDKELTANQERIAALEAQLQQLQQPKEGVPPV